MIALFLDFKLTKLPWIELSMLAELGLAIESSDKVEGSVRFSLVVFEAIEAVSEALSEAEF